MGLWLKTQKDVLGSLNKKETPKGGSEIASKPETSGDETSGGGGWTFYKFKHRIKENGLYYSSTQGG